MINNSPQHIPDKLTGRHNQESLLPRKPRNLLVLILVTLIYLTIAFFYFLNILQWGKWPEYGWSRVELMGTTVLVEVYGEAKKAGLRKGDKVVGLNGERITSYFHLQQLLNRETDGKNIYEIQRDNQTITIAVSNIPLGLVQAFYKYGLTWLLGIIFFMMGAIVFYMKPETRSSRAFLSMMFNGGLYITFMFVSKFTYAWLGSVHLFSVTFFPASLLHIAMTFPVERTWLQRRLFLLWIPYLFSFCLFLVIRDLAPIPANMPALWRKTTYLFLILSLTLFLFSNVLTFIKSSSISRGRSKIVLIGTAFAVVVPILYLSAMLLFRVMILPNTIFNLPFLTFFPLSIAYAIAKHNLFDVDVYVKRAVGYGIMTAVVGLTYFSLQVGVRTAFQPVFGEHAEKIYAVLFAIIVVFLFNPLNRTVQTAVDKLFYRKKFDYKETVTRVSNALTSMLDLDEVIRKLINTVRLEMFIDKAGVLILNPQKKECQTLFIGDETNNIKSNEKECIKYDDPFIDVLSKNRKLITIYDINEDPSYRNIKNICSERFSRMGVSMVLPLIYQGDVTGALALGYKKSGHFYTREDIDLLETLTNHGAVAIENAKLAEQMKKEETVRTNLARYLSPQIVDQIITKDVQVNLGGDRKVVTVLFSDIRNFTRISETQRPDQLVQILNEYFTEMARIIFENQGSLDKYIGDAIVAVFGSLIPLDNSAKNAVHAAVQMMKRMPVLNEKWMKEYGFSMDIGVGINTGEVFLGNIGSPERMEFTVIGDTVNVASRFSGLARPGQILITQETQTSLDNDVPYRELPQTAVKGKTEKLDVFEILYS